MEQKIDEAKENIRKAEVRWELVVAFSPAPAVSQPPCGPLESSLYTLTDLKGDSPSVSRVLFLNVCFIQGSTHNKNTLSPL